MGKPLAGRTIFITGASRGIGLSIALRAARDGANIVIAAKTAKPHPKLPGTIYTAAKEIEDAGGRCLPCIVDVRDEQQVKSAVKAAVDKFGGIDILVNNASAISVTPTLQTEMKRYDLMNNINTRGTFLVSKECIPYLLKSDHGHILNISPPLNLNPMWFGNHVAYTIAKYGMSMCVLGMSNEFKGSIGVNALWPKTVIHTAALAMLQGEESDLYSRKPDIMADAAYHIFCSNPKQVTGRFFIDEDVLKEVGITDFTPYACHPENVNSLIPDVFLDEAIARHERKSLTGQDEVFAIENIFKRIRSLVSSDLVRQTNAIFHFNVTGHGASNWFVNLKNGKGSCGKGDGGVTADVKLTLNARDFVDIFSGKLKPTTALVLGKLTIKGDVRKAMKLEHLLGHLKSKL